MFFLRLTHRPQDYKTSLLTAFFSSYRYIFGALFHLFQSELVTKCVHSSPPGASLCFSYVQSSVSLIFFCGSPLFCWAHLPGVFSENALERESFEISQENVYSFIDSLARSRMLGWKQFSLRICLSFVQNYWWTVFEFAIH